MLLKICDKVFWENKALEENNWTWNVWLNVADKLRCVVDANWKQTGLTYLVSPLIQFVQTSEKSEFRHAYGPKEAGLEIIYL